MGTTRRAFRLTLAICIGWLGACAAGQMETGSPRGTVTRFARALEEHRFEAAYGLMDDDYRARVTLAEFRQAMEAHPEEAAALADKLSHATGPVTVHAEVIYDPDAADGGSLRLDRGQDGWRITTPVALFYDQSTPRAALRAFVRAMRRQRYDVVLRLMPNADKQGITVEQMQAAWSGEAREEAERVAHNLAAHLEAPIEILGDRATMPYGDGLRVQFLREGDLWKIEDPE